MESSWPDLGHVPKASLKLQSPPTWSHEREDLLGEKKDDVMVEKEMDSGQERSDRKVL